MDDKTIYESLGRIQAEIAGVNERLDALNGQVNRNTEARIIQENKAQYKQGVKDGLKNKPKTFWDYMGHVWEAVQTPAYVTAMILALKQMGAF